MKYIRRKWIYREAYAQSVKIKLCHARAAGVGLGVSRTTSDSAPQLPRSLRSAGNSAGLAESQGQPVLHMCPNHAIIFGWGLEKQCVGLKSPHILKMYSRHEGTASVDIRRSDEGAGRRGCWYKWSYFGEVQSSWPHTQQCPLLFHSEQFHLTSHLVKSDKVM